MTTGAERRLIIEQELKELVRLLDNKASADELRPFLRGAAPVRMARSRSQVIAPEQFGRFGRDLSADFAALFRAFNRMAKHKLDVSTLANFASVTFADSIYERRSTEFSAQLTQSSLLYYQLFDAKIVEMQGRFRDFREAVEVRLEHLQNRIKELSLLIRRLSGEREIQPNSPIPSPQHLNRTLSVFRHSLDVTISKSPSQPLARTQPLRPPALVLATDS
jgi:hypothetical protein